MLEVLTTGVCDLKLLSAGTVAPATGPVIVGPPHSGAGDIC
jgi:hypothetical protein